MALPATKANVQPPRLMYSHQGKCTANTATKYYHTALRLIYCQRELACFFLFTYLFINFHWKLRCNVCLVSGFQTRLILTELAQTTFQIMGDHTNPVHLGKIGTTRTKHRPIYCRLPKWYNQCTNCSTGFCMLPNSRD